MARNNSERVSPIIIEYRAKLRTLKAACDEAGGSFDVETISDQDMLAGNVSAALNAINVFLATGDNFTFLTQTVPDAVDAETWQQELDRIEAYCATQSK